LVIGVMTVVYGGFIIYKYRPSEITHYRRVIGVVLLESIFAIIVSSLGIVAKAPNITPWTTYFNIHANWSDVKQVPSVKWRDMGLVAVEMEVKRWFIIFCAFVVVVLVFFLSPANNHRTTLPLHNEPQTKTQSRHAVMTTFTPSSDSTLGEKIDSCDRAEVTSEIGSLPPTPMSPAHFQSGVQSKYTVLTTTCWPSPFDDRAEIGSPIPKSSDPAPPMSSHVS